MSRAPALRVHAALLGVALSGAACGRTDVVVHALPDEPVEIELALGEERVVAGTDLRVRFSAVEEDSRCPVDVTCVWQGNAAVRVALAAGEAPPHEVVLNTTLEPRSADWGQVRVTLLEVIPEPREGQPPADDTYGVRLRVEPLEG